MFQRIYLKFILTAVLVGWALFSLHPIQDQNFGEYITAQSPDEQRADFLKLMDRVSQRIKDHEAKTGKALSVFVALKQIGREERLDLTQYFPQLPIESSLKNPEKRNDILLDYLFKQSKGRLQLGLDLAGGVAFVLETPAPLEGTADSSEQHMRKEKLGKAIEIIGSRINSLGVAEPVIRAIGENRIEVQLPGVSTKENPEVGATLRKPARLEFRLVHPQLRSMPEPLPPAALPPGYVNMAMDEEDGDGRPIVVYNAVKRIPEMTGETVADAYPSMDMYGGYQILLRFTDVGAKRFADLTGANVGQLLGIVLDGKLYSAPRINDAIRGGSAQITGRFSQREAVELSNVLNNPLDVPLEVVQQSEVGPTLAKDAVASGVKATIIGAALVCGFMLVYYLAGGFISVLSLLVNIVIILGVMASFGATLTLPGLAGIVLTMGMAVDANILIFERMREELAQGKSLHAAHTAGYDKALWTILDSHITQLCICGIMIWLGTGPIKGFGVTLAIGVFSTLFSVLVTGRVVMDFLIERDFLKRMKMLRMLDGVKVDWMKLAAPAFVASWVLVLIGIGAIFLRSDHILGVDFTGGDQVTMAFTQQLDVGEVRRVAGTVGVTDITPSYQSNLATGTDELKIETPYGESRRVVEALQSNFPQAGITITGEDAIGPAIGSEIASNAALSVGLALVAILLYIGFRFEFGFGMGAVIATVHDVLLTCGMFVIAGVFLDFRFNAPMVAAILAIIGYSVNDTVVVFDRIREELKLNPDMALRDVVNMAINRVFARSIITSLTTFLAAISLFIFGGGVLRELSFTFIIGILVGTFSSICIAAQFFFWWHKGERRHVEAHRDIAPKYEWEGASKASN